MQAIPHTLTGSDAWTNLRLFRRRGDCFCSGFGCCFGQYSSSRRAAATLRASTCFFRIASSLSFSLSTTLTSLKVLFLSARFCGHPKEGITWGRGVPRGNGVSVTRLSGSKFFPALWADHMGEIGSLQLIRRDGAGAKRADSIE
jgi:hypothetical protein